jgi:hypothetical protein
MCTRVRVRVRVRVPHTHRSGHLPGIRDHWFDSVADLKEKVDAYSVKPPAPVVTMPRVAAGAALVGLPLACYRSQCFRRAFGAAALGVGALGAWGFYELNDRISYYNRPGQGAV